MTAQIKTIDKLPRIFLISLAKALGYKAWVMREGKTYPEGVRDDVSDWELADFISRSI